MRLFRITPLHFMAGEQVWRKAPDGRILISVEGFESWVETGLASTRWKKTIIVKRCPTFLRLDREN